MTKSKKTILIYVVLYFAEAMRRHEEQDETCYEQATVPAFGDVDYVYI